MFRDESGRSAHAFRDVGRSVGKINPARSVRSPFGLIRGRATSGSNCVEREFAPGAGSEAVERERAETGAMEREHGRARGSGEHAAHLVIAAFGERELGFVRREKDERGGSAGCVVAVEAQRAAGEERDQLGRECAIDGGAVDFGNLVLRRGEAVHEGRLIGDEEEAAGVFVEAADAGERGIAGAPAGREKRVDVRTLAFVVRADEAERFVQEKQESVGMIERLAVDAHGGGIGFLRGVGGGFSRDGDAAGVDPSAGFAAAAIAEVGEELVEAAHSENVRAGRRVREQKVRGGA